MEIYKNKDWLEERYGEEGLSAPEIAELAGVPAHMIYYQMKKHNIPRRSASEAHRGVKHTLETRLRMSKSHRGKKRPPEHCENLSKALRGKYRGEQSSQWKGGRNKCSHGYIRVYAPDHPNAVGPYVLEHRLFVEKALGRYLKPDEFVHHINGIRGDNRLENLQLINHHRQETCPQCGWPMGNIQEYVNRQESSSLP